MTGVWLVTGTDTGVGKTVVTAALAACAGARGLSAAVLKPAESGAAPGVSDVDTVRRLAAPASATVLCRYPDPLAPRTAARVAGLPELALPAVVAAVRQARDRHEVVLVEGAGGLLVPMGRDGWTVADLAVALRVPAVLVVRAGLGTLNHTALALEALATRSVPAFVVLGAWPARPEPVHRYNLVDLPGELAGVVPDGAGTLDPAGFRRAAPGWLSAALYGTADPARLRTAR